MYKVAVLISGSGSNMESIINYSINNPNIYEVVAVIADREAKGIEKAKRLGVKNTFALNRKESDYKEDLKEVLLKINPDFIVLAGFLSIIDEELLEIFKDRIINIHPSLLPLYGGMGMHGKKVHEAVLKDKRKVSGCTCHIVNGNIDGGRILKQKEVPVLDNDTAETLSARILPFEHETIVEGLLELIKTREEN